MTGAGGITFGIDSPIGFIGAGRLGASLAAALHGAGFRIAAVHSRTAASAGALAERVPGCSAVDSTQAVAEAADIVFITTPDAAIEPVCAATAWRPGQAAVHCSGALPVSALGAAAGRGALTGGMHILQTFPNPDSAGLIPGASTAVGSDDAVLLDWLQKAAYALGSKPFTIRDGQRAAYHASAVMSCGLVAALMGIAAEMWEELGVSRHDALLAMQPLTAATVAGVGRDGLPAAFTGPAVRGDIETVRMHLETAARHSPETGRAYAALARAALPLFSEHEGLSAKAAAELRALLDDALSRHHGDAGPGTPRR